MNKRIQELFLVLGFLSFFCGAQAKESKDQILTLIEGVEESNQPKLEYLLDTLEYISGKDIKKALSYLHVLEKHANTFKNVSYKISTDKLIAQNYLLSNNADSAAFYIKSIKHSADASNDTIGFIAYYNLHAWLSLEQNNPVEAQSGYYKGYELAKAVNAYSDQMTALIGLSSCYGTFNEVDKQYKYLYRACKIAQTQNLTTTDIYENTLYNLASLMQQNNRIDSAIIIYEQLEAICLKKNYLTGLAGIANNVAHIYVNNGDYTNALRKAFQALKYDSIAGAKMYVVSDYVTIGQIYSKMEQTDSAVAFFQRADRISQSSGLLKKRLQITERIAELYANTKQYKKAYQAFKIHLDARDSFNISETQQKLLELELQYKTSQVEAENQFLQQAALKDKNNIRRQTGLIAVLLVAFIITFFQLRRNRKSRKKIQELNTVLTEKNNELGFRNETKTKFFSIVSHDLKGPIGTLSAYLNKILDHPDGHTVESLLRVVNLAQKDLSKSYNLLDNLLIWAKSQFEGIHVNRSTITIPKLIEDTLEPLEASAKAKHIRINRNVEASTTIVADEKMLSFILRNLIQNAIKFSDVNSVIDLAGHKEQGRVSITVKDYGLGMSKDVLSKLFQSDNLTSTLGTQNEAGTGLGLMLSKELADKNNIGIEVESTVGEGTKFTVSIPT